VYVLPPQGGGKGHQETCARLHQYMGGNWEALQEKHTIKTLTLTSHIHLELSPNPTPPPSTWLHHTLALVHVREYVRMYVH
jgi:hypothetical protein